MVVRWTGSAAGGAVVAERAVVEGPARAGLGAAHGGELRGLGEECEGVQVVVMSPRLGDGERHDLVGAQLVGGGLDLVQELAAGGGEAALASTIRYFTRLPFRVISTPSAATNQAFASPTPFW